MKGLLHPTYFPDIAHFTAMLKSEVVYFETCDNYQKQSLRNRTKLYGANGELTITIPVNYSQNNRQPYKAVRIANEESWQDLHLKTLESAYNMSPFFEYYIDDLMPLFRKQFNYLLDFNFQCLEFLLKILDLDITVKHTLSFEKKPKARSDFRYLAKRNTKLEPFQNYTQVFTQKHGFISNLSILDLLFNEGPNTLSYLKKQYILPVQGI